MAEAENDKVIDSDVDAAPPNRLKFDYIKSNFFRVVHADGMWGGVTPTGDIHMDVWSHRTAIPRETVHEVNPDGTLGTEITEQRETRNAIVREVEVGIVLDLALAKLVVKWLEERIAFIEEEKTTEQEAQGDAK